MRPVHVARPLTHVMLPCFLQTNRALPFPFPTPLVPRGRIGHSRLLLFAV